MRFFLKIIGIFGLVLVLGLALFWWLRMNSPLFNFFFRPSDFSQVADIGSVNLEKAGFVGKINFHAKYPGSYLIMIEPVRKLNPSEGYDVSAKLNMKIFVGKKLVSDTVSSGENDAWFRIFRLAVPKDFPLRKEVEFQFEVVKPDHKFHKKYGKAVLKIEKDSDE